MDPDLIAQRLYHHIERLTSTLAQTMDLPEQQALPQLVLDITTRAQQEWVVARHGRPVTAPQPVAPWNRLSSHDHE